MTVIGTPVPTRALWTWSAPVSGQEPVPLSYPTKLGCPTKSGVQRPDLEQYIQVPIQRFGNPPTPIDDATVVQWIRYAEDEIETETNIRLCQTWIAAPPSQTAAQTTALNLRPQGLYQQLGVDYDFQEAGYDFFFERARDSGWLYQRMRWRPVKGVNSFQPAASFNPNSPAAKNASFIYPLLNEFFRLPSSWAVEDQARGLLRFVPATSIQMLPLFAMQLAFLGFTDSVPQGMWFQYTAGLTNADYVSDWSFMRQLVLAKAGITAFRAMQTMVNFGAIEVQTQVDGLAQRTKYSEKGAFSGQITQLQGEVDRLIRRAKQKGGGFHLGIL